MKFNTVAPTVETSSKDLEEKLFSIGDSGIVFDVLRSKMYSNPISAICREISCNARDAHREVGRSDIPIEIYLPNIMEPYFKIKDIGPGISPDRIENIYIKYGASSKRNDESLTGMYGLGAKTPFSYSDTFTITTVHNNIKYNYSCIIDETKVGKLILLDKAHTDDYNGTEIIIPVKNTDFKSFAQWIEHATRYWKIKPIFKGGNIDYKSNKKILSGDKWDLLSNETYNDSSVKFIVDDIEYQMNKETLSSFINNDLLYITSHSVFALYFNIGEISLSANREQVFLDKKTQAKIKERFDEISSDIKQSVSSKINQCKNYWEALITYSQDICVNFTNIKFLGPMTWNGLNLHLNYLQLNSQIVYNYTESTSYRRKKTYASSPTTATIPKLKKYISSSISFTKNTLLVINDLFIKDPSSKDFKSLMLNFLKENNRVLLICPTDQAELDQLNLKYKLDKMAYCSLSTICKKPSQKKGSAPNYYNKLIVYKAQSTVITQVPYSQLKNDNNKKVLCTFKKGHDEKLILLNNNKVLHESDIINLALNNNDYSFYFVSSSYPEDLHGKAFPGFQTINSFLSEKINEVELSSLIQAAYYLNIRNDYYVPSNFNDELYHVGLSNDNLLLKLLNLRKEISINYEKYKHILKLYCYIIKPIDDQVISIWLKTNTNFDVAKLTNEIKSKYKILKVLDLYSYNNNVIESIIEYVNLIDEKELRNV